MCTTVWAHREGVPVCLCACVRAYLGISPGASDCSVCRPCWICMRACMARGLVITESASGFCICHHTQWFHQQPITTRSSVCSATKTLCNTSLKAITSSYPSMYLMHCINQCGCCCSCGFYLLQEDGHMGPELFLQLRISGK